MIPPKSKLKSNSVKYSELKPAEYKANQDSLYLYNTQEKFNDVFKRHFNGKSIPFKDSDKTLKLNPLELFRKAKEEGAQIPKFKTQVKTKGVIEQRSPIMFKARLTTDEFEKSKSEQRTQLDKNRNHNDTNNRARVLKVGHFTPNSAANSGFLDIDNDSVNKKHGTLRRQSGDIVKNEDYVDTTLGEVNNTRNLFNGFTKSDQKVRRYSFPHQDVVHPKIKPVSYEKYHSGYISGTVEEEDALDPSSNWYDDGSLFNHTLPKYKKPRDIIYDNVEEKKPIRLVEKKPTVVLKKKEPTVTREVHDTELITPRGMIKQEPLRSNQEPIPVPVPAKTPIVGKLKTNPTKLDEAVKKKARVRNGLFDFLTPRFTRKTDRVSFGSVKNNPTNQHKGGTTNKLSGK
jgi:hypothetical protein